MSPAARRLAFAAGAFVIGALALRVLARRRAPIYRYVNRWRVAGPIDEVAAVLRDADAYPRWWPSVYLAIGPLAGEGARNGDDPRRRVRSRGFLPYDIEFVARVVEERLPHGFTVEVDGEMQGRGEWQLAADGPMVDVVYRWEVSGNKPLWRATSWALRPLFEANHDWAMRRGEESLRLELARRRARTAAERDAVAPPPAPVRDLSGSLVAIGEILSGRRLAATKPRPS